MLRFALTALALLPWTAMAQEAHSFKDWSVICSVTRHCTLFGFGPDSADMTAHLRLERAAGPDAPLQAWIVYNEASEAPRTIRLGFDDPALAGLPKQPQALAAGERRIPVPANEALIASLRKGKSIQVDDGSAPAPISLSGAVAALTWLDDRQGRVGTPSALIAKTGKGSTLPAPITVILRKPVTVTPLAVQPTPPAELLQIVTDTCSLDDPGKEAEPQATRLTDQKILWEVVCEKAAYNINSLFFIEEKGELEPAVFLEPRVEAPGLAPSNMLTMAHVNPEDRTVSSFARGRGMGDCGVIGQWIWDGVEFRLQSYLMMPECRGVPSEDWPDMMQR